VNVFSEIGKPFANCAKVLKEKFGAYKNRVLRHDFYKDRVWLGTILKMFSDFAENVHNSAFWAKTAKKEVRNFFKTFRVEIWREI